MTISRLERNRAAELVRRWRAGQVSNYELEDQWPKAREDYSLEAIGAQLWLLYDDNAEEFLDELGLSNAQREMLERVAMFLNSDCEYLWPQFSIQKGDLSFFQRLLPGANRRIEEQFEEFKKSGRPECWPFICSKQLEEIKFNSCHPRIRGTDRSTETDGRT
jgi:hypothetical protein